MLMNYRLVIVVEDNPLEWILPHPISTKNRQVPEFAAELVVEHPAV